MADEVGAAFVSILPSARGFAGNLSKELSPGLDKAGREVGVKLGEGARKSFAPSLKSVAAGLAGAFAAVKVGGFLKDAISQASDLNESASKVNVVFGEGAGAVRAFAKTAAKGLGQTQQQALEAAGTFGNLFVSMKLAPAAAAQMSTTLVKLAGDLASFNNVDPGEALDALRSSLAGETEPMRRFGVNITAAAVQAKALSSGLVKSSANINKVKAAQLALSIATAKALKVSKDQKATDLDRQKAAAGVTKAEQALAKEMKGKVPDLTAAQKAQATYALVMEQTATAQGDFARTSGGLANQQRILSAQFNDLKSKIGSGLLPVAVTVTTFLTTKLGPALSGLGDTFAPAKKVIGDVIDGFRNFDAGASGSALFNFGQDLRGAFDKARDVAKDFFAGLRAEAGPSGDAVFDMGVRIRAVGEHLFDGVKVNVKPVVTSITTQLRNVGQPIIDALQVGLQTGDFSKVGAALGEAFAASLNGAVTAVGAITKAVGNLLSKVDWVDMGVKLGKQAPALLVGLAVGILSFDPLPILRGLGEHWKDVVLAVLAVGFLPAKLLGGIASILARVPLAGPLLRWAFEGFASLSKSLVGLLGRLFGFLGREFVVGMRRAGLKLGEGWGAALSTLPTRLGVFAIEMGEKVGTFLGRLAGFFLNGTGLVARAAGDVAFTVLKAFRDMTTDLFKAGAGLIASLIRGILSKLPDVGSAVGKVAGKVKGFFPGSPVKEGPLTSWNGGGAGKRLVAMLAEGLSQHQPAVDASARLAAAVKAPQIGGARLALASAPGVAPQGSSISYTVHNPVPEAASVSHAVMLRRLSFLHGAA